MRSIITMVSMLALLLSGCGDDDDNGTGGNAANKRGVGAECANNEDCTEQGQVCLPFKGGYCGIEGCTANTDCPEGSACVTHTDSTNYCFLTCTDKLQCNANRTVDNEANCSSSITFVDDTTKGKACVPPSG